MSPELYAKGVTPPQTAQVELLHDVHAADFADMQEKYQLKSQQSSRVDHLQGLHA